MSNNRGLKNRVAISNAIDREIYEKLKSRFSIGKGV